MMRLTFAAHKIIPNPLYPYFLIAQVTCSGITSENTLTETFICT